MLVLLVEDEYLIPDLIQTALEDAGYTVQAAANGEDGLKLLADVASELAGLVTDVNLGPGVSGWEVAKTARELNQSMPVVYVTGDSAHRYEIEGVPHSRLVQKPFVPADIVVALSTLRTEIATAPPRA